MPGCSRSTTGSGSTWSGWSGRSGRRPRARGRPDGVSLVVRHRDLLAPGAHGDRRLRADEAEPPPAPALLGQDQRQRPDRPRDHHRGSGLEPRQQPGDGAVHHDGREAGRLERRSRVRAGDVPRDAARADLAARRHGRRRQHVPGRLRDHGGPGTERGADRRGGVHPAGARGHGPRRPRAGGARQRGAIRPARRRAEGHGSTGVSGSRKRSPTPTSSGPGRRRRAPRRGRGSSSRSRATTSSPRETGS